MSKILFLGAAPFQVPPIRYAKAHGHTVLTLDNVPWNPGHALADKVFNISVVDRERILAIASAEAVDAVMTFGSDIAAPSTAYVAGLLGLPGNPLRAVETLASKKLTRQLLHDKGFQSIDFHVFADGDREDIIRRIEVLPKPVVVKPTDSSGSKGVSIVTKPGDVREAVERALSFSIKGEIIAEQHVARSGPQICGDGFFQEGRVVFVCFGDGHFYDDGERLAPFAETFPSTHDAATLSRVRDSLEAALGAAGFHGGPFNFDVLITADGSPFIVEIGPRNGGNFIPRAVQYFADVNFVEACVEFFLRRDFRFPVPPRPPADRFVACFMIHSETKAGRFKSLSFDAAIERKIIEKNPYLRAGADVMPFRDSRDAIANVILKFDSAAAMKEEISGFKARYLIEFE